MINLDHEIPVEVERSDQDRDLSFETDDSFTEVHNNRVESEENIFNVYRIAANETALTNNSHFGDEFTTIAPGERNMPLSILNDCHCEESAHPHLFPTGKFDYQVQRDPAPPFCPVKYFNQRFLNYTHKFASDSDYIFFCPLSFAKIKS